MPANFVPAVCERCGSDFKYRPAPKRTRRYCSRACWRVAWTTAQKSGVEFLGEQYYRKPSGYFRTVEGVYLHRAVWQYHLGPVPKGMEVHHLNEDKSDNRLENLVVLAPGIHHAWHKMGCRPRRTIHPFFKRRPLPAHCMEPGCPDPPSARARCRKHYSAWRKRFLVESGAGQGNGLRQVILGVH